MCTLDVHHKSQHFVTGDNRNLLHFFVFYNHDCNIKIWTHYYVQISNHICENGEMPTSFVRLIDVVS